MERYSKAFGGPSSTGRDWRWLLALGIGCYGLTLALRLSLWSAWDNPMLRVGDEFIMSTHDTYLWLAHARVAELGDGRSLAYFTRLLHEYLGFGLGDIGFWAPAVLASLVTIPCLLWGWLLGGRSGAVFGGITGALAPGFFARSKLGYYDTDLFTLLMPMLTAFWLAWWLRQRTSFRWLGEQQEAEPSPWLPFQVLAMGLFTRFGGWWHQDIANYSVLLTLLAIAFGLVFARSGRRSHLLFEGTIFMLAAVPGSVWNYVLLPVAFIIGHGAYISICIATALGLAAWQCWGRKKEDASPVPLLLAVVLLCAAIVISGIITGPLAGVFSKLLLYLKPASPEISAGAQISGPLYPRVTQSIIEAKLIPLDVTLERSAYYFWTGLFALAAIIPVLMARPMAVLLLPFVAISLLSMKMGIRFSMFGGAALMVFLGVAGAALCRAAIPTTLRHRELFSAAAMAVLALCLLLPKYFEYKELPPTPVLDKAYAEALIGLGERAPKGAVVWTWWDWGYATQYYAGLRTPSDGAKHAGRDLYPTAVAMTTDSPLQANQLMRYCAAFPNMDPTHDWAAKAGAEVQELIAGLGKKPESLKEVPPQYLAVSYKDIRIATWIFYYGNWNVTEGTTRKPTVRRFGAGQVAVNLQVGGVMTRGGQKNAIVTADMVDMGRNEHYSFPQNEYSPYLVPKTPHLVFNKVAGETNFFESESYESMLVTLFTGDPESDRIKPYFRLVADGLPFIRIYEVVQN